MSRLRERLERLEAVSRIDREQWRDAHRRLAALERAARRPVPLGLHELRLAPNATSGEMDRAGVGFQGSAENLPVALEVAKRQLHPETRAGVDHHGGHTFT